MRVAGPADERRRRGEMVQCGDCREAECAGAEDRHDIVDPACAASAAWTAQAVGSTITASSSENASGTA